MKINLKENTIASAIRYNLKIIFANKFVYFLILALIIYLLITIPNLFNENANFDSGAVYWVLIFPGILLIIYPSMFSIQDDLDKRMLETIFGIPNYRYKVYLVRLLLTIIMTMLMIFILNLITIILLAEVPVFEMPFQLMFPLLFICTLSFMFSTLVKNGYATAAIMIIFGLFFFFGQELVEASRWNLFHNPFHVPSESNSVIWSEVTFYNRIYLIIGSILAVLWGLKNLQNREGFVK